MKYVLKHTVISSMTITVLQKKSLGEDRRIKAHRDSVKKNSLYIAKGKIWFQHFAPRKCIEILVFQRKVIFLFSS